MKKTKPDGPSRPQAWIAVSNNRQKVYDPNNIVYLDSDQEFQIELFNSENISYLAKIEINGKMISSSGLILKPGQRYFLDRFIDENKKFLFSTYEVEGDNPEVENAIRNNGLVSVYFYPESSFSYWIGPSFTSTKWGFYGSGSITTTTDPTFWRSSSGTSLTTSNGVNNFTSGVSFVNTSYVSASNGNSPVAGSLSTCMKETGRVEGGSQSDQSFSFSNMNFNSAPLFTSKYHILPRSVKGIEISDLRSYCTECGGRIKKKTWKFCPSCGENIS
jgi:hypothetical protein